MTAPCTPADLLRAAAARIRETTTDRLQQAVGEWLERTADSWGRGTPGYTHDVRPRIQPTKADEAALTVARLVLGEGSARWPS